MAYYVRIEKPREFRRDVLESSKKVISCLQRYRQVTLIREQKKELMVKLQTELKEIALLIKELDKIMPEKQLRQDALRRKKEQERKAKEAEKKAKLREKELAELAAKESQKVSNKAPSTTAKKKVAKKAVKKAVKKTAPPKKEAPKSEAEKLNDALSKIQARLSSLE